MTPCPRKNLKLGSGSRRDDIVWRPRPARGGLRCSASLRDLQITASIPTDLDLTDRRSMIPPAAGFLNPYFAVTDVTAVFSTAQYPLGSEHRRTA